MKNKVVNSKVRTLNLISLLLVLIAIAVGTYINFPITISVINAFTEIDAGNIEIVGEAAKLNSYTSTLQSYGGTPDGYTELNNQLQNNVLDGSLLREIYNAGNRNNVSISTHASNTQVDHKEFTSIPILLILSGEYSSILKTIEAIEKLPYYIQLQDSKFTSRSTDQVAVDAQENIVAADQLKTIDFETTMQVYTYKENIKNIEINEIRKNTDPFK